MSVILRFIFLAIVCEGCLGNENTSSNHSIRDDLVVARPAYRQVLLTGFTRAHASLPLVAETSGKVLELSADIGDSIDAEGRFVRLDTTFIRLDLESNRVLQDQLRTHIRYNTREMLRLRTLAAKSNASKSQLDQVEDALEDNRHKLASAQVEEKVLRERLHRSQITAPPGWRVTGREVELGQLINAGQRVGKVADYSLLRVPFALTPEQLAALKKPTRLQLELLDLQQKVPASIYHINPGFDANTRKIDVDLSIAGDLLASPRGGLRAQLRLDMPERTGAILLPQRAVSSSYEEHWVTRESGELVSVVVLGLAADGQGVRVVGEGLRPGERFRQGDQ